MSTPKGFMPYENEEDSFVVGANEESGLTIENRLDRISLYGSLELTKDKEGLKYALELKRVIDSAVEALKKADLPDKIEILEARTVKNPF